MLARMRRATATTVLVMALGIGRSLTSCSPPPEPTVAEGRLAYAKYCALCHGANGEGYVADEATRLASPTMLSLASDAFLERAIVDGRAGTTMSAWGTTHGGPLDPTVTRSVILYLRSLAPHTYRDTSTTGVRGDREAGAKAYATHCESCHGTNGEGGRYVALAGPSFLATASDGFLLASIDEGRPETPMPGYARTLPEATRRDLVALLRSWQRPVESPLPAPPRPGSLERVVIGDGAPNAEFPPGRFVPADTVKAALDAGRRMVILDARPPSDYSRAHIAHAISAPFYETADYAAQIPKDAPVVTYCGCPHAESGVAADTLRARGYTTFVLDEGFTVWRERGYPVRGGPRP